LGRTWAKARVKGHSRGLALRLARKPIRKGPTKKTPKARRRP